MDLLETWDVDVIYEFDRTHENMPDLYWAAIKEKGIQLRFNQDQILDVIFVYLKEKEGFCIADPDFAGIQRFESYNEVNKKALNEGVEVTTGEADFFGEKTKWIRLEYPSHSVHYSFDPEKPDKVTLQKRSEPVVGGNE